MACPDSGLQMPTAQSTYVITETSYPGKADVAQLDAMLRAAKDSAKLTVGYNQGSVQWAIVERKTRVSPDAVVGLRNGAK